MRFVLSSLGQCDMTVGHVRLDQHMDTIHTVLYAVSASTFSCSLQQYDGELRTSVYADALYRSIMVWVQGCWRMPKEPWLWPPPAEPRVLRNSYSA